MKLLKRSICVLITLSIASTLAGCGPKRIDHKYLIATCEDEDYTELDDYDELQNEYNRATLPDAEGYINCTGKEAENIFPLITRNDPAYEDLEVTEITALVISDEEGCCYANVITFKTSSDAEYFFNDYAGFIHCKDDEYDYTEDSGKESDYSFKTLCQELPDDQYFINAVYYSDDSVLFIWTYTEDTELCSTICKNFGVASPLGD